MYIPKNSSKIHEAEIDGTERMKKFSLVARNINTALDNLRISREKVSEDIGDLSTTINQLVLFEICRIHHLTTAENIFFYSVH